MDKLRAIEVFTAIAEHGSMTKAAIHLGKSIPTVVRTLAALEGDLGVRLFNRSTRRIALTEEGEIYLAHCARMNSETSLVESRLRGNSHDPSGLVHISAPVLFGEKAVTPAVTDMLKDHPNLSVRLFLLDRVVDLMQEHIDIAVRFGNLEDSALIARQIGVTRTLLCASPDLIARDAPLTHPRELATRSCIQFNGNNAGRKWRFEEQGKPIAVEITGRIICNMNTTTVQACVAGLGYGLFYNYQAAEHIRAGKLQVVLPEYEIKPLPLSLVYPHSRLLSPRVQFVLEQLRNRLGSHLDGALSIPDQPR